MTHVSEGQVEVMPNSTPNVDTNGKQNNLGEQLICLEQGMEASVIANG